MVIVARSRIWEFRVQTKFHSSNAGYFNPSQSVSVSFIIYYCSYPDVYVAIYILRKSGTKHCKLVSLIIYLFRMFMVYSSDRFSKQITRDFQPKNYIQVCNRNIIVPGLFIWHSEPSSLLFSGAELWPLPIRQQNPLNFLWGKCLGPSSWKLLSPWWSQVFPFS